MGLNVVDNSPEVIEKRRFVSPPPGIVISKWACEPMVSDELLEIPHCRGEYYGTPAPLTDPPISSENAELKIFR
jgi:hypothetical protein